MTSFHSRYTRRTCIEFTALVFTFFVELEAFGSSCTVSPADPAAGSPVTLTYSRSDGPLSSETEIFVHLGFNSWAVIRDTQMTRVGNTDDFTYTFTIPEFVTSLEVTFFDGADIWDNNNGADWIFPVTPVPVPAEIVASALPAAASKANVMMQGYYWDVPQDGTWYDTMASKASALRNMEGGQGIDRIWFPPPSKGASGGYSMGYDPYDYYDLGSYDQKGTVATRFGTQEQLKNAIAAFKAQGISCLGDMVLNHRYGGASEFNPNTGSATDTDFSGVASGKCTWTYNQFHPSTFEIEDDGTFEDFPDVCHMTGTTGGTAYYDLIEWGNWLRDPANAGFDGWRLDLSPGYRPSFLAAFRTGTGNGFGVMENWYTDVTLLDFYVTYTGGTPTFDFAAYNTLQTICNDVAGAGDITDLVNGNLVYAAHNPAKAVTFCANHDMDLITSNKMLGYAFILTYQGYPCIFWTDYFDQGLATLGGQEGNGINRLVWVRGALGGGHPTIQTLKSDDSDLLVYGTLNGTATNPGYIVAINDNPNVAKSATVTTDNSMLKDKTLRCYAWYSYVDGNNVQPANVSSDANGTVTVEAPPSGYAVYGPDVLVSAFPEWSGVPSSQIHDTTVSNGEWIYTGEADDYRTFSGATADSDITEVRVTSDETYVYFRIGMQNISDATLPAVGIALDTNQDTDGSGYGWIGDASTPDDSIYLSSALQYAEKQLMFYTVSNGQPAISIHDGSWHAPASGDSAISVNPVDNAIEARINKSDLGIGELQLMTLSLASFRSSLADVGSDATYDSPAGDNDAIDVMGGDPGISENAWVRGGLFGNTLTRYAQIVLGKDGAETMWIGNQSHFPADGDLDASDNLWLDVQTWPKGVVTSVSATVAINGEAGSSQTMSSFLLAGTYDAWYISLGRQPVGATLLYSFTATDANGNTVTIDNNGALFSAQVNPIGWDSDGDGIPDWWMLDHFGHAESQAADQSEAGDDPDGDGATNEEEFAAGTDPLSAFSFFRITAIAREPNGDVSVTWSSVLGKSYQVLSTASLFSSFAPLSGTIPSDGPSTNFTDTGADGASKFYKVILVP